MAQEIDVSYAKAMVVADLFGRVIVQPTELPWQDDALADSLLP